MRQINEEYRELDRSPHALRRFGLTIGSAFLLLGALLAWRHRFGSWTILILGAVLIFAALVLPRALKLLHRIWMTLALTLGFVMTQVILTVIFFLVVTPIGLLQRLFGKSSLDLAFRTGAESYWETRAQREFTAADYEKQF
ncbi:MAG: SxtJ family membrane protein [Chthoniobacterales bacterium]